MDEQEAMARTFKCPAHHCRILRSACIARQKKAAWLVNKTRLDISYQWSLEDCIECETGRRIAEEAGVEIPKVNRKRLCNVCRMPDCLEPASWRGLCRAHYHLWRTGDKAVVEVMGIWAPAKRKADSGWMDLRRQSIYTSIPGSEPWETTGTTVTAE